MLQWEFLGGKARLSAIGVQREMGRGREGVWGCQLYNIGRGLPWCLLKYVSGFKQLLREKGRERVIEGGSITWGNGMTFGGVCICMRWSSSNSMYLRTTVNTETSTVDTQDHMHAWSYKLCGNKATSSLYRTSVFWCTVIQDQFLLLKETLVPLVSGDLTLKHSTA